MAKSHDVTLRETKDGTATIKACRIYPEERVIDHLGVYFDVCNSVMKGGEEFWFRGNADITWDLTPSALRKDTVDERNRALSLLTEFRRYVQMKIANAPGPKEDLNWVQLARHHGLPTRLLDWTKSAVIALYFACDGQYAHDGGVFILNPVNLNRQVDPKKPRVFDCHSDAHLIEKYLKLSGVKRSNGRRTIAIYPVWNSERIMLQQGVFTLAGSREFALNDKQAPGLVCMRIRQAHKKTLLAELDHIGINEMSIFPEPEHTCNYLTWRARLNSRRND